MEPRKGSTMKRLGRNGRSLLVALLVALHLSAIPTVHAEAGVFAHAEIALAPEVFTADLHDETREGDDAVRFREIIDEDHGNADGMVSADELDTYRAAIKKDFNDKLSHPFAKALVQDFQVNGRAPLEVRVTDLRVSANVLGPTTDDTTILRDISAEMRYPSTSRDRANVTFANDFRQAFVGLEWGYARFTGSAPWAIDPATIDPGDVRTTFWTGDGFNVTYAETPEFASGFDPLGFQLHNVSAKAAEPETEKDSPAPGLPLLLLVVAAAALVLRRR